MVARGRRLGRGGALMLALLAAACGERPVTGPTASPVFAEGEARGVVVATRDARDRLVGQMPEAETAALVRALDTLAAALDAGDAAAARAALAAAEAELSELAAALPSWAPDLTAVALVLELAAPALAP